METHRRPGARRLEEIRRGTLHPPRRPLTVFDDARATAVAATRAEAPELVAEVGRLRSLAFADEVEATGECYGLDEYDDYYWHLVVIDKTSGDVVAGTRLGFGREILGSRGWRALYTAGYRYFGDGMVRVACSGVKIGRTWVHPLPEGDAVEIAAEELFQATGTLQEFQVPEFEEALGTELDDNLFTEYEGEPALQATSVALTRRRVSPPPLPSRASRLRSPRSSTTRPSSTAATRR